MRSRYYDTDSRIFTTSDTYAGDIYDPLSINAYTFAENNPVNYSDPSGHGLWSKIKSVAKNAWNGIKKGYNDLKKSINGSSSSSSKKKSKKTTVKNNKPETDLFGDEIDLSVLDKHLIGVKNKSGSTYHTFKTKAERESYIRRCTTKKRASKQKVSKSKKSNNNSFSLKNILKVAGTTLAIVGIGALSVATGGAAGMVLMGVAVGAGLGGTVNGISAAKNGKSFANNFVGGAISGGIQGGLGAAFGATGTLTGGAGNGVGSLVTNLLDRADGNNSKTNGRIIKESFASAGMGILFSAPGALIQAGTPVSNAINYSEQSFNSLKELMPSYSDNLGNGLRNFYGVIDNLWLNSFKSGDK